MKKILALILCFGILAAFSACGSEPATESPDAAPASDAPASEAPTSEPAKETYTFAFLSNTLNNTFQSTMSDTFQRSAMKTATTMSSSTLITTSTCSSARWRMSPTSKWTPSS